MTSERSARDRSPVREDEAKLEALRRESRRGEDAYRRGEFTVIERDRDLDRLFETAAAEADEA